MKYTERPKFIIDSIKKSAQNKKFPKDKTMTKKQDPKNCTHTFHRLGGIDDCPVCNPEIISSEVEYNMTHLSGLNGSDDACNVSEKLTRVRPEVREWWIEGSVAYCEQVDGLGENAFHVIEKSAYDAVVRERDAVKSANESQSGKTSELVTQLAAAKAEVERLTRLDYAKEDQRRADGLTAARAEISKLKAENWVLKDNSLRTYDGLAEKADKYDGAVKLLEKCEKALECAEEAMQLEGITCLQSRMMIAELRAFKSK